MSMTSKAKNSWRTGQMLVIFCGAAVVLLCLAAISIDVGHLTASHGRVQNAADAASLAALLELWEHRSSGANEAEARAAAQAEAEAIAWKNYPEVGVYVDFGVWDGSSFSAADLAMAANSAKVRAFRNEDSPGGPDRTFVAGIMGINTVDQWAPAIARFKHRGLIPFAIDEESLVPPGETLTLYDDTEEAPGNCGLLDFDGGENSNSDLMDWTTNGYIAPFSIDPEVGSVLVEGCTGLKSALKVPIGQHISEGDEVVACIYRTVSGVGANATFEVIGFCTVILTGLQMSEGGDEIEFVTAEVVSKYIVGTAETEGTMRNFMHLQLVE